MAEMVFIGVGMWRASLERSAIRERVRIWVHGTTLSCARQLKYSAYGMIVFPCFFGGITTGQEAGQMATRTTWRHDVRCFLEKDRSAGVNHLQAGTVPPEHHFGSIAGGHG